MVKNIKLPVDINVIVKNYNNFRKKLTGKMVFIILSNQPSNLLMNLRLICVKRILHKEMLYDF